MNAAATQHNPARIAETLIRLAGGAIPAPAMIEKQYKANAAEMRYIAKSAAANPFGKCRGYTAEHAAAIADTFDKLGPEIAAELRRLGGEQ